ncbi:hypothetical protein PFISCL1PPCAC_20467 [Pristionchus fissidentatus]|uniref:Uncharacterized protein n=1 Tax=Pristionchus fissidentatus TaxID=1538716 RepID=A0AAV5UVW1_9BILA|nr:hypothetical protein PFISCL1PPCAC_1161 [Pristionchus fissidentatus]GMT29170.1 hypothetical protein PFISCL1PPCAC_20467 [Pristionchus fissidentatus]
MMRMESSSSFTKLKVKKEMILEMPSPASIQSKEKNGGGNRSRRRETSPIVYHSMENIRPPTRDSMMEYSGDDDDNPAFTPSQEHNQYYSPEYDL